MGAKAHILADYFIKENLAWFPEWDGTATIESVKGKLDWKVLTKPLPCGNGHIPVPFEFDGSSSGIFRFIIPKWRHPIASARHDWRCKLIRDMLAMGMSMRDAQRLRKIADGLYKDDLGIGQTSRTRSFIESSVGYIGVRIGAFFGAGMRP